MGQSLAPSRGAALAGVLVLLLGSPTSAQEPRSGPPSQRTSEADLVFEREVFRYPAFQRRNPFQELLGDEGGPRFEQIVLRGIIYSDAPGESVALLSLRGQAAQQIQQQVQQRIQQQEAGTAPPADTIFIPQPARRLRVGQSWGNVRILQIQPDHVVVAVTEFGVTEQRTLTLPTRRQGGR